MSLWRITEGGPQALPRSQLSREKVLEADLEEWIVKQPEILGEPLLIVGQQVEIPDTRERIDLLALDAEGKAVIIELKCGQLRDPVDMQALRYASYVAKWGFDEFEKQAHILHQATGDPDFNFNDLFESFCAEAGADETPDINEDQRIIIVGSDVADKLGSVALWLSKHRIDIKVIEIRTYRDGEAILLEPTVVVPMELSRFEKTGAPADREMPWLVDGRAWHLEKRCSPETRELLLQLQKLIQDNFEIEGPRWHQKFYVSYWIERHAWIIVRTRRRQLLVEILVPPGVFESAELAKRLGIEDFQEAESLSEKLGRPSSVDVRQISDNWDRVSIRMKEDFDVNSESFLFFLREAYERYLGHV